MPYLRTNIEPVITVHHGHMPEITLLSDTTARGIWAMEDKLWWPEGSPLVHLHGYGHYHETYEKSRRDMADQDAEADAPAPSTGDGHSRRVTQPARAPIARSRSWQSRQVVSRISRTGSTSVMRPAT